MTAIAELARPAARFPGVGRPPEVIIRGRWMSPELEALQRSWSPKTGLGRIIRDILPLVTPEQAEELLKGITRTVAVESQLAVAVMRVCPCGAPYTEHRVARSGERRLCPDTFLGYAGRIEDYGITSRKLITTAGVGFLVDAWQNSVELENMKYHGLGTGSTAESASDTALVTELTTQYGTDNTRPTGSLTEGASANIFRTVGTSTLDASATIAEHGIFSQAANSGGVLWDRSLTGGQALGSGDSIQTTYDATCSSGG